MIRLIEPPSQRATKQVIRTVGAFFISEATSPNIAALIAHPAQGGEGFIFP